MTVFYSSNQTKKYQIYAIDNDGVTKPIQITSDPLHHYSFVMPCRVNNKLLCARLPGAVDAHMGVDPDQTVDLVTIDLASKAVTVVADKAKLRYTELGHAEWSPDGTEIVAYANDGVKSMIVVLDALRPNTVKRIIDQRQGTGLVLDPSWSADGKWIVYVDRPGWGQPGKSGIIVSDAQGGSIKYRRFVVAEGSGRLIFDPQPSPSGDCISFLEFNYQAGWGDWNLKRVNFDGFGEVPILSDQWLWSRGIWLDNDNLVTHGSRGKGWFGFSLGGGAIWRTDRNGKNLKCLVDTSADEVIPSA